MAQQDSGVRVAVAAPSRLGESPVWDAREAVLYWCDIAGRALHRFHPASGASASWSFGSEPASCTPCRDGGLLLACRDGLWRFDTFTGERTSLVPPPYDITIERFNDGKCDPHGRFWVGTMYEPRDRPLAALYRYDGTALQRKADGITTSNGLAWSPDGRTMYWSDTRAHTIYACDVDAAGDLLSNRRVFARFAAKQPQANAAEYGGRPDGATVDAEGCYWVAMFEGQRLLRLSPVGEVLRDVRLPVRCPTMPCFAGADLKTLYITTARENRPPDELAAQPLAGCVLALTVDVPGVAVPPFG